MRKNQASITASGIAMLRAMESEKPRDERLFYDPYARRFVSDWLFWLGKIFIKIGYAERRGPGVQGFLAARERYIDDYLQACLKTGIQQLVILGAGFDARAYRFREALQGVNVFEVDHPATQAIKLARLKEIQAQAPQGLAFVSIDFNTQSLQERLLEHGYDPAQVTLFIWQGVTQYLSQAAVDSTLAFVRQRSAPGSSIIFDYVDQSVLEKPGRHGEVANLRRYRGLTGEGLTFGLAINQVETYLESRGFVQVQNAVAADFTRLYFFEKPRPVADGYGIATGVVPEF